MKKSKLHHSQGISLLGMLTAILLVCFGVMLVVKMLPPYMENYAVKDAMKDIANEPNSAQMSKAKIKDKLERRLQVESINAGIANNLVVEKKDGKMQMMLKYENRVAVFGNIDFVFKFDEQVALE
ncbi:MAG: DUF4845 domain-containing protein [Candidatus Berkiella sp.]